MRDANENGRLNSWGREARPQDFARFFRVTHDGLNERGTTRSLEIPEIFDIFGPQRNAFTSVGIFLRIFVVNCSNLSGIRPCRITYASLYITNRVVPAAYFTATTLNFTNDED